MLSTALSGMAAARRRRLGAAAAAVALAGMVASTAIPSAVASAASGRAKAAKGAVVAAVSGEFGTMLVAGSGQAAGTALYTITSDYGSHLGCTTKLVQLMHQKLSCTGGPNDQSAEWPAYLTSAPPVAGPGVTKSMLGEVKIKGLGEQVTYDGHPLYLFDGVPGLLTGENWFEPTLPPWHGAWYTVSPAGSFLPRTALLGVATIGGKPELGAYMEDGGGFLLFPVYSFSGTSCTGACAAAWPPVISQGTPGTLGALSGTIGSASLADGTTQLTYNGAPLYFDANEALKIGPNGAMAEGNGNGASGPGGTFSLVTP